jgi:microcystin-dependent protein
MSIIAAGITSETALVSTGDITGALILKTNGSTTAVTIGANQVISLAQPLPVGSGGTGATSLSGITSGSATNLAGGVAGAVPYQSGVGATGFSAAGSSGQVLTSAGTSVPTWTSQSSLAAGTATTATTATNLASGSAGTIPYQTAAGTTAMLATGTAGQVLTSAGTAAPTWETPAGVPAGTEALWPTNTPPTGWLQENGASLSRTGTYAALFAVIGTTYGTANGSSFNLPDSRARFIRIWANGSALDPNAGSRTVPATAGATMSAGDNVGTNQAEDFLSHRHNVPGAIASVGSGTGSANRLTYDNGDFYSGYVGGSETRPVNTYRMMIIKY